MDQKKIVIIGAGPTGLGAAYRLNELGYQNWVLYEKADYVGGHSCSHVDEHGFVWDEGGHVIFSHYPYFDKLVDDMLGREENHLIRESWIVKGESWVPYPFQNNLRYLPKPIQVSCLIGAAKAAANHRSAEATNFRDWILANFGEGIAEEFMFPYNSKVWTTPLEQMSKSWMAERVATVDFKRLLENVLYERDDAGWGPNSKFRFPMYGGTGEIYRRMVKRFPGKIRTGKELAAVDDAQRRVSFADGSGDTYDALISTAPLDRLAGMLQAKDGKLTDAAANLCHNNLLVIGLGLEKKIETGKCWIYFADPGMPCYRSTYFSHYSPFNVPGGDTGRYSSLMCEVSYKVGESPDVASITDQILNGLIRSGMLEEGDQKRLVSRYHRKVPYSYPIPTLGRDQALSVLQPELLKKNIYSRGRFGAWRYEIGNMDHSVMMGVEAVNNILSGEKESVFHSA
ncbi:MAG TPA: FAD-dependent oxidoreductase [Candidatus Binatia bacterium]|nr:FAD-dependent oxidoreductase [Candidatus Binatia bacterium]